MQRKDYFFSSRNDIGNFNNHNLDYYEGNKMTEQEYEYLYPEKLTCQEHLHMQMNQDRKPFNIKKRIICWIVGHNKQYNIYGFWQCQRCLEKGVL